MVVVVVVAHFALLHQLSERSCTIWWRSEPLVVESTVWWNHLVETSHQRTGETRQANWRLLLTHGTYVRMVNGTPAPADFDAHQRCVLLLLSLCLCVCVSLCLCVFVSLCLCVSILSFCV